MNKAPTSAGLPQTSNDSVNETKNKKRKTDFWVVFKFTTQQAHTGRLPDTSQTKHSAATKRGSLVTRPKKSIGLNPASGARWPAMFTGSRRGNRPRDRLDRQRPAKRQGQPAGSLNCSARVVQGSRPPVRRCNRNGRPTRRRGPAQARGRCVDVGP